ncbi:uncharacterized protein ACBT57_010623 [Dama dama]|uniref:uncharacterized protein LOC133055532 n=1 Tax=Dama dama TaxID=30532 RepID=UPI002A36C949|nr:uncharacterized protein LOC133055532 [Dama dama]
MQPRARRALLFQRTSSPEEAIRPTRAASKLHSKRSLGALERSAPSLLLQEELPPPLLPLPALRRAQAKSSAPQHFFFFFFFYLCRDACRPIICTSKSSAGPPFFSASPASGRSSALSASPPLTTPGDSFSGGPSQKPPLVRLAPDLLPFGFIVPCQFHFVIHKAFCLGRGRVVVIGAPFLPHCGRWRRGSRRWTAAAPPAAPDGGCQRSPSRLPGLKVAAPLRSWSSASPAQPPAGLPQSPRPFPAARARARTHTHKHTHTHTHTHTHSAPPKHKQRGREDRELSRTQKLCSPLIDPRTLVQPHCPGLRVLSPTALPRPSPIGPELKRPRLALLPPARSDFVGLRLASRDANHSSLPEDGSSVSHFTIP